jgi:hypothetical protein
MRSILKKEPGLLKVHADELVDDFKVLVSFQDDPSGKHSLLDVFDAKPLADALRIELEGRPVVGICQADEDNGVILRVCVSDVAFLHGIRDKFLQGIFGSKLEATLRDVPRKDGKDSLGELTIQVDHSHFAEHYYSSILRLNKLTPHQRQKLDEVQEIGRAHV